MPSEYNHFFCYFLHLVNGKIQYEVVSEKHRRCRCTSIAQSLAD